MTALAPTCRPYQDDGLNAIGSALNNGMNRVLVKMPTGTGKTVMFAELLKRLAKWLEQYPKNERRMMVIAHREELLDQAAAKIQAANPGLIVSIEQGDRVASRYADVVVASIQTLAARKFTRLKRLQQWMTFRIVVVDEAHHAAARTYMDGLALLGFLPSRPQKDEETGEETGDTEAVRFEDLDEMEHALGHWNEVAPKDRLLVGVTATPNRSDAIGLSCVFQDIVYSYALRQAITDEWLVPIVPYIIETATNLDDVKITAGDFNQKQLAEAVNVAARNKLAVKGWLEQAEGLSTLAFTVDVKHAHAVADEFNAAGRKFVALSGETPKEDRRIMLRQYTEGQIEGIANCMVLTEGTDLPRTGCILHLKPTKSATLYEQMTGRGLRLYPDKTKCIVLDVADVARRHSLQTAPTLYGLPPGVKGADETLDQMADEFDELREKFGVDDLMAHGRLTLEQLRIRCTTFNVWEIPSLGDFGTNTKLNWIKVDASRYRMQYPYGDDTEILEVAQDLLGKWEIVCTIRPKGGGVVRQRTLAHGIATEQAAATMAEAYVQKERSEILRLKDRNAAWKQAPASPAQINLLQKFKLPHNRNTTKGQASDMLDLYFARNPRKGARR